MSNNKTISYITYQTFPANTANSLQTISNIKYLLKNNIDVTLVFPLRENKSSDDLQKINEHYGENLNINIEGTKHNYPFGKFDFFRRFFYIVSHFLWSRKVVKLIDLDKQNHSFFTRSDWVFYFLSKKKYACNIRMPSIYKIKKIYNFVIT